MTIATRINHALWPHAGAALVSLLALAACGPEGIVEGAGGAAEDVLEIDELAEGESQDRTEEEGVEDASSIATESTETGDAVVASLPGQEAQAVPKRYTTDVRVMSFNTRIDKTDVNLDRLSTRTPRIKKVIAEYSPDIIGIQEGEKDTWSTFFNAVGSGYGWAYRTRGGVKTPNELVAVMYKTSRFELQENTGITITRKERRDRGGCPNNPGWGNRTVQRLKLRDKLTNEIIDVFNTHFVAGDQCEKDGMARIAHDYVRKFGDNALFMGDFNTGISKTGSRSTSYKTLTSSGFLTDTYVDHIGISTSGEDTRGPHGHSYITGHANTPWERLGYKIDHIFTAPAFNIYNAGIDRSLFWGSTLIDCQDANSAISSTVRAQCRVGSTMRAVTDFNVASDHWAIWADVNRTSCKLSSCAPSK